MTKVNKNFSPANRLQTAASSPAEFIPPPEYYKHWRVVRHLCKRHGREIRVPFHCYDILLETRRSRSAVKALQDLGFSFQTYL